MSTKVLRYNISDWKQLTQCLSNTSSAYHIKVREANDGDLLTGTIIEVVHDKLGVLFSYLVDASGNLIDPRSSGDKDLTVAQVLDELSRFGFLITFDRVRYLPEGQLNYLRTLKDLNYDKLRVLYVREIVNGVEVNTPHIVVFNIQENPGWMDNKYACPKEEFIEALDNGSASNLDDVSETKQYRWDWLDFVADIQDILDDNIPPSPEPVYRYSNEEIDEMLSHKQDAFTVEGHLALQDSRLTTDANTIYRAVLVDNGGDELVLDTSVSNYPNIQLGDIIIAYQYSRLRVWTQTAPSDEENVHVQEIHSNPTWVRDYLPTTLGNRHYLEVGDMWINSSDDSVNILSKIAQNGQLSWIDITDTYSRSEVNDIVVTLADNLVATIDTTTYVMTLTLKHDDQVLSSTSIDLPLESTVVSGDYDSETKSLILTLVSGNVITIPIGDLVEGLVSTEDLEVALSDKLKKKVVQQLPTQNIDDNTIYLVPTNSSDTSITFNNGTGIYSDAVVVNNYSNFIGLEVDEDSTAYVEYIIVYLYDKNNVQIGDYQYIYSNNSFNMIDVSMATTVKFMNISTDAGVPNTTTLTYKLVNDDVKDRTIKNLTSVEFNYGSASKEIPDTDSIEHGSGLIFFKGIRVSDILGDTVTVETDELLQTPQPYVSWGYGNSEDSIIGVTGPMSCDVNETTLTYTIPGGATNYDYIFFPIYDSQSSLSFRNGILKYNSKNGVTKKKLNDLFYEKKEIDKLISSKDNIWEDIGSVNKGMSGTSTLLDFNDIAITKPYKAFRILYYVNPSSSGIIQIRFNGSSVDSFWFGGGSTVSGKKFTEIIIEDNYMKNIDGTNNDYYATAEINRCNIYNYGQRTNFFGTCQNLPRIQDVRSIQLLIGANWTFDNTGGATVILQGIPE